MLQDVGSEGAKRNQMSEEFTLKSLRILHLDDDPFELERFQKAIADCEMACDLQVESFSDPLECKARLEEAPKADISILDIHIDSSLRGGVSLVEATRLQSPTTVILMCSAMDDFVTISECLSRGADDFLSKRTDRKELGDRILHSFQLATLKKGGGEKSKTTTASGKSRPPIIGSTLERISQRVPNIISSAITAVHISGESGTGKEMVADLFSTSLGNVPFIKVNCGAITPTLLESELFGHVKGSFTGAINDKKGLIEAASGGWIFLDEVATLSPSAQVALLRVIENQELLRVGSTQPKPIQVRVLSATNEPLPQLVKEAKFRKDLWQRLCEAEIMLPPLRERPGEIEALVHHFCAKMPGGPYRISETALEVLSSLPWKSGNVRELRNCLRAMTELHVNKLLTPLAIPERIWKNIEDEQDLEERRPGSIQDEKVAEAPSARKTGALRAKDELVIPLDTTQPISYDNLSDLLLLELTKKLSESRGKLSLRQLAKIIGVSRSTLSGRLKGLVQKNLVALNELVTLVGLSQK